MTAVTKDMCHYIEGCDLVELAQFSVWLQESLMQNRPRSLQMEDLSFTLNNPM